MNGISYAHGGIIFYYPKLQELAEFQSSELQDRDDYKDTERILNMLRHQKELKSEMKEYQAEHHKATYMDDAWNNNSVGLGLGLW